MYRTVLPLVTLLAACGGGNYCQRSAKMVEDCGDTVSDEDLATCEEAIDACNGDDKDLLDESLDCLEEGGFLTCDSTTGTTTDPTAAMDDLMAMLACYTPLSGLSEECAAGFGMTMTTPSTMSTM